jgi:hypothetical protein
MKRTLAVVSAALTLALTAPPAAATDLPPTGAPPRAGDCVGTIVSHNASRNGDRSGLNPARYARQTHVFRNAGDLLRTVTLADCAKGRR